MEAGEILKTLADYALAAVFVTLYVRSQSALAAAYEKIAEQRREENREMRQLLFELARIGASRAEVVDRRGNARIYDVPDERPITESRRPPGFPPDDTPLPMP